jgi:hypothetical protein
LVIGFIAHLQLGITNNYNDAQIIITHISPCQSLPCYGLLTWDILHAFTAQERQSLFNSKVSCNGNCSLLYNPAMDRTENIASNSSSIVAYMRVAAMM